MSSKRVATWTCLSFAAAVGMTSVVAWSEPPPAAIGWAVTNPPGNGKYFEGPYKVANNGTLKVMNNGPGDITVVVHGGCGSECTKKVSSTKVANSTVACIPVSAGDVAYINDDALDGQDASGDVTVP